MTDTSFMIVNFMSKKLKRGLNSRTKEQPRRDVVPAREKKPNQLQKTITTKVAKTNTGKERGRGHPRNRVTTGGDIIAITDMKREGGPPALPRSGGGEDGHPPHLHHHLRPATGLNLKNLRNPLT